MDLQIEKNRLVLGQLDTRSFLADIHCLKFFGAQLVIFAVFSGTSPSASLSSSWSLARANRAVDVEGSGLIVGGRSSRSGSGSASAFPGQSVQST